MKQYNVFMWVSSFIIFGFAVNSSTAMAYGSSPWFLGAGAIYSPKVYKGTPTNRTIIPMLGYEGENFFFRGIGVGYRLNSRRSVHNIVFRATYDPRTFKPKDSNIASMRLLDRRKGTILSGLSYQYMSQVGMLEASAMGDTLGVNNGMYGEVAWRLPIRLSKGIITPSIGYSYNSNKLNQHLYGVSAEESARTDGAIRAFDIGGSGQYFIGFSGNYFVTDDMMLVGGVRYTNLDDDIGESPILDSAISTMIYVNFVYAF